MSELLTDDEHEAMDLTVELYRILCDKVVGDGPSREQDLQEITGLIHQLQRMILSQAAPRAYPNKYRLLGDDRS